MNATTPLQRRGIRSGSAVSSHIEGSRSPRGLRRFHHQKNIVGIGVATLAHRLEAVTLDEALDLDGIREIAFRVAPPAVLGLFVADQETPAGSEDAPHLVESRRISPPSGSGVRAETPPSFMASRFATTAWPLAWVRRTGFRGAAALSP